MRSSLLVGQILGLCLPVLFISVPAGPSPASQHVAPVPHSTISIRLRDGAQYRRSVTARDMDDVSALVESAMHAAGIGAYATTTLRTALAQRYGSSLHVNAVPMGYALEWDGTQWVIVCRVASMFEVDFGVFGTVVIETTDSERVP